MKWGPLLLMGIMVAGFMVIVLAAAFPESSLGLAQRSLPAQETPQVTLVDMWPLLAIAAAILGSTAAALRVYVWWQGVKRARASR